MIKPSPVLALTWTRNGPPLVPSVWPPQTNLSCRSNRRHERPAPSRNTGSVSSWHLDSRSPRPGQAAACQLAAARHRLPRSISLVRCLVTTRNAKSSLGLWLDAHRRVGRTHWSLPTGRAGTGRGGSQVRRRSGLLASASCRSGSVPRSAGDRRPGCAPRWRCRNGGLSRPLPRRNRAPTAWVPANAVPCRCPAGGAASAWAPTQVAARLTISRQATRAGRALRVSRHRRSPRP